MKKKEDKITIKQGVHLLIESGVFSSPDSAKYLLRSHCAKGFEGLEKRFTETGEYWVFPASYIDQVVNERKAKSKVRPLYRISYLIALGETLCNITPTNNYLAAASVNLVQGRTDKRVGLGKVNIWARSFYLAQQEINKALKENIGENENETE